MQLLSDITKKKNPPLRPGQGEVLDYRQMISTIYFDKVYLVKSLR